MELIERVKKILESYYICDECLGRQFHNLIPDMPNKERGKILRKYAQIESSYSNKEYKEKEGEECYLCKNLFDKLDYFAQKVVDEMKDYEYSTFLIGSIIPKDLISREEDFWEEFGIDLCETFKSNFNRNVGIKVKKLCDKNTDFEKPDIMATIDIKNDKCLLQVSPVYIKGSYRKLYPRSGAQKIIINIFEKASKSKEGIFYSIGRLENNVVTSAYRPFIIALKNPKKRNLNLNKLREKLNLKKSIKVSRLSYCRKEDIELMKRDKILASYSIFLKLNKFNKDIKEKLVSLEKKRIIQILKNKIRKPYIRKIRLKFKDNDLEIYIESTVGFSINSFLSGRSKPNLKKLIGRFKVEKIILRKYTKMKTYEMY